MRFRRLGLGVFPPQPPNLYPLALSLYPFLVVARLSRKLRVCKWVGTVGCALVAAAFMFSEVCSLGLTSPLKRATYEIWLTNGLIEITRDPPAFWSPARSEVHVEFTMGPGMLSFATFPYDREYGTPPHRQLGLPLWLPFLLLFIPTLLLWRRDRRRSRPDCCPRCDYDLTGNVTGVCPECGLELTGPVETGT